MRGAFAGLLAVLSCLASLGAQVVVLPSGLQAGAGNASTGYPWQRTNSAHRVQYCYDASHFTTQGISGPIRVLGLRWRARTAVQATTGGQFAHATVELSSAAVDQSALSANFATNHGPDRTVVFAGPLLVQATAATLPSWYVDVPCTPFLYDPGAAADLLIDIQLPLGWSGGAPAGMDCLTLGALATRVYHLSSDTATTGVVQASIAPVLEVQFQPAVGLFAEFGANATAGPAPLQVSFVDRSWSSAPSGVLNWAWDFDGDAVVDSTLQHPTHVFASCGSFSVTLTVSDALHAAVSQTKTNWVVVDGVQANFTASCSGGFAPLSVAFADASSSNVTAWQWDFDGDAVVDATGQNPTWVYATPGSYQVALTVSHGCHSATRQAGHAITVLAPGTRAAAAELLQYQTNEVRGTAVGNSSGWLVTPRLGTANHANFRADPGRAGFRGNEPGFGCMGYRNANHAAIASHWPVQLLGSFSASFWLRRDPAAIASPMGYVFSNGLLRCFVGGAAGAGVTFRGTNLGNVDSGWAVGTAVSQWQHWALVVDDTQGRARWYRDGLPSPVVTTFSPSTFQYTGPDLVVGAGDAFGSSAITQGFDLDDFRLYARALTQSEVTAIALRAEDAAVSVSGSTCAGPNGSPEIGALGVPDLGNAAFAITLAQAEDLRPALLVVGIAPAGTPVLSLQAYLGMGCELQTDVLASSLHFVSNQRAQQALPLPNTLGFAGKHFYAQWLVWGSVGATSRLLDIALSRP